MRRDVRPLVTAILVALLCGSVHLAGCEVAPPPAAAAATDRSLRVMTFNIRHGMDGRGRYNLQRAVEVVARVQPDLVGLQEITRNHSMYECDDQPAKMAGALSRATGRAWYHVYVQQWYVDADRKCVEGGKGDGPNTEGLAFLAPAPLGPVTHHKLKNARIGLAVRMPAAADLTVIVTHLDSGSQSRNQQARAAQVEELLAWAEARGTPRLVIGDMNALPDAAELVPVLRGYRDAWSEAMLLGTSRGIASGATRVGRRSRVDYVFFTPAPGLRLEWAEVVDTSAFAGVHASDHHPVVASFRLPSTADTP